MKTNFKKGQTVKYSKPINSEESKLRFVVLEDVQPDEDRVDIQCTNSGLVFAPIEVVELSEVEAL